MNGDILAVNKRVYPKQDDQFNPSQITCVLVSGEVGDYAAYAGQGTVEWVKDFGDKVSFAEACFNFPEFQLDQNKYRK